MNKRLDYWRRRTTGNAITIFWFWNVHGYYKSWNRAWSGCYWQTWRSAHKQFTQICHNPTYLDTAKSSAYIPTGTHVEDIRCTHKLLGEVKNKQWFVLVVISSKIIENFKLYSKLMCSKLISNCIELELFSLTQIWSSLNLKSYFVFIWCIAQLSN